MKTKLTKTYFAVAGLLLLLNQAIQAQIQFEQALPPPPAPQIQPFFDGVYRSSIALADIDGDTDPDLMITGINSSFQRIAKLYKNDGSGGYTEVAGLPLDGVDQSSIAFADIDSDSDPDLMITGRNSSSQPITKLYTNDGSGGYIEVGGTPFEKVKRGSIAFADIDGDSDQDVLITGENSSDQPIAKLYTNDGSGSYTELAGTPFDGVKNSSIAFTDIDGDGDQDVLITGENSSDQKIAKLYTSDGSGGFIEVGGTPFEGVRDSSIAFADVDGDSHQDVLITGRNNSNQFIAKLYNNNGSGDYSEVTGTPFDRVFRSSIAFEDIDGDTDLDVLITGYNNSFQPIAKLYTNDGSGGYTEMSGTSFDGVRWSSIAFADVDGDNDPDVLITGKNNNDQPIATLYTNDGNGVHTEYTGTPFEGVALSSIAFADIDGDSDPDVLITGENSSDQKIAKLYNNDGSGVYNEVMGTPFNGIDLSSVAFADIDGDNDLDLLITGRNSSGQEIAQLYNNDGIGDYSEVTGTPFEEVKNSSIAFADIDGDSDQDVMITGNNNSGQRVAKLYTNDGSGGYTEVYGTPFESVAFGSISFVDIDGDNDQDLLITGRNNSWQITARLYTNDGNGSYTEVYGTPFDGVVDSSVAFADIDGDGDQDVLITGKNSINQPVAQLYTNDGSGGYTEMSGTPFEAVKDSSIAFADIDGDSDQDVLITGKNNSDQKIAKIYTNDGIGGYTEVTGIPFDGVDFSSIAFADIDGDNDPDVLITGQSFSNQRIAKLYRNTSFEFQWTGAVDNSWTNSGNWSSNTLPSSNDKVVISNAINLPQIELSDNIEIKSLSLRANSSLDVLGILKVEEIISNHGIITFKSDAVSTGQLDEFNGIITGIGDITVERYIPVATEDTRAFRFLTSAVDSNDPIYDNWQESGNSPAGYGTHITGSTSGANGFDASISGNPSMYTFDNAYTGTDQSLAWEAIPNTDNQQLVAGEAYRIFIRGDRNYNLNAIPSDTDFGPNSDVTLRATGSLITGNYMNTLNNVGGYYSLIGNPYQAVVDINNLTTTNVNTDNYYIWDPNMSYQGAYVTHNLNTGINDKVSSDANEFIMPGQSFYVQTLNDGAASLQFTESTKAISEAQTSVFSDDTVEPYINLTLYKQQDLVNGENESDGIAIIFSTNGNNNVDARDATKLGNPDENLARLNSGQYLSIEERQLPTDGEELELYTAGYAVSDYTFQLNMNNMDADLSVYLTDQYTGDLTLLSGTNQEYEFSVDTSIPPSTATDRFNLVFQKETFGVEDNEVADNFKVYPNPVDNDQVRIQAHNMSGEVDISLSNMLGQRVMVTKGEISGNGEMTLNIGDRQSGVYFIELEHKGNTFKERLIIK